MIVLSMGFFDISIRLLFFISNTSYARDFDAEINELISFIDSKVQNLHGGAFAIIKNEKVIYKNVFGYEKNDEKKEKHNENNEKYFDEHEEKIKRETKRRKLII